MPTLRERWQRERAGEGFLNPVYFTVGVRWLTWVAALGILLLRAAPDHALRLTPLLLALTGLQLSVMTLYLPVLRPGVARAGLTRWMEDNPLLLAADIAWSALVLYLTGGWNSPFYEFALTSVIAPALKHGLRGANLASVAYTALFLAAVRAAPGGLGSVYDSEGRLDGGFVQALVNPFMVAWFCALLAEVFQRLRQERERARLLAAREERRRLAREIHDGVAQAMFMLTLSLEALRDTVGQREVQDLPGKLDGLLAVSRQALWEVRNAMLDVDPLLEGETGISQAVGRVVREFRSVSGLPGDLAVTGDEPEVPPEVRLALYRLVQEGLANAFRHAGARRVDVELAFTPGRVEACIRDDGRGFDPATVKRGRGLDNMEARVAELGGTMELDSGEGTQVRFAVPLREGGAG